MRKGLGVEGSSKQPILSMVTVMRRSTLSILKLIASRSPGVFESFKHNPIKSS